MPIPRHRVARSLSATSSVITFFCVCVGLLCTSPAVAADRPGRPQPSSVYVPPVCDAIAEKANMHELNDLLIPLSIRADGPATLQQRPSAVADVFGDGEH